MNARFSEDVVPLTDMKTNPARAAGAYASPAGGSSPRSRARCTASSRPRAPSFAKMPEIR